MAVDQRQQQPPHGNSHLQPEPCCSFNWQPINNKWNSNQEVVNILCNARNYPELFTTSVVERPPSGTQLLFARHDGNWFKNDGYEWRRRKGGRLIREDHMDLKVNKQAVISAHYAHSAIVPSFHRRIYTLRNDPQCVLVHYLNKKENEGENDYGMMVEMTVHSLLANSLYPTSVQLAAQLAPIYNSLQPSDVQLVSEAIVNMLNNIQQEQMQPQATPSHSTTSSNPHLERRNSCSSAFRRGLSSLALRRQPSTFSDSIDVNFAGVVSCSCANERMPPGPLNANQRSNLDVNMHHNASSSPSGGTTKSSNQDEDSLCLQHSISESPAPIQSQFAAITQTPVTDITPNSGTIKGGTKILIIGSFFMKGHEYSVQFGDRRVPARLLQVGVLSLFSPPSNSVRSVPVTVYCNGQQVSQSVNYKYIEETESVPENEYLQSLVDRIQLLLAALYPYDIPFNEPLNHIDETVLLRLIERITPQNLRGTNLNLLNSVLPSRTVLHYAVLLNYPTLIRFLLSLRSSTSYNRELSPLSRDVEGMTALHLAMKMGHSECARMIIRECQESLDVLDDRGRTPGDIASDDRMRELAVKRNLINFHENPSKTNDHVSPTELWVMTNGETVTREHLLLKEKRVSLQKPPMGEEQVSSFSMLSDADGNEERSGERQNWQDETPLHVEISMDTNVFVPDSPKMADLFEAVTSPGVKVTDVDREKMAQLAKQIIEAIPPRIKQDASMSLIDEDISPTYVYSSNHYNPLLSQHGVGPDWEDVFGNTAYRYSDRLTETTSSLSAQPSASSFDHNRLYPNNTRDESFSNESSRANTFESTSFDFDNSKDLGEFFNLRYDAVVDPLQQSLGNLKLTDGEQREVYEAAMIIQRAYREYRARSSSRRQADVERRAAVTIQSFYRRYKKFCYFKKLHNAAIVVQKHFRMKKNRDEQGVGDASPALEVPEHPTLHGESIRIQIPQTNSTLALLREHRAATTIQHAYRGHRKRQAAARKIQKFMKESRQKLRKMAQNEVGMSSAPIPIHQQHQQSSMQDLPMNSTYNAITLANGHTGRTLASEVQTETGCPVQAHTS